jgi:hypothetical protein
MSTAGKVLTILSSLVALVWILLTASVTELNNNGTKAIDGLKQQLTQIEGDVVKSRNELHKLKSDTHFQQLEMLDRLAVLQSRQADSEKSRSVVAETASRVHFELEQLLETVKGAEVQAASRVAERKAETKALDDSVKEVKALSARNDELIESLTGLRNRFLQTLQQNREMTQKLLRSGPVTRRATLTN